MKYKVKLWPNIKWMCAKIKFLNLLNKTIYYQFSFEEQIAENVGFDHPDISLSLAKEPSSVITKPKVFSEGLKDMFLWLVLG